MTDDATRKDQLEDEISASTMGSTAPQPDALPGKGLRAGKEKSDRFPAGIPFIVGNEGAERFSFYGMKAILFVFMSALYVQFAENVAPAEAKQAAADATQVVHLFIAGVYLFPLVGAIVADRLLGKFNVIFWVSIIYSIGNFTVAAAGHMGELGSYAAAEIGVFIGLALIALGSGGIKPCVSANVGDQFGPESAHLVTKVYQIFYFIINFGSFFSTLLTPFLFARYGALVAFGVPGVLMVLATFVFWLGRKRFRMVPPNPGGKLGLLDSVVSMLLLSPIFVLIVGFFAGGHGEREPGVAGFFAAYWPHLAVAAAAVALGLYLFGVRQRIQRDSGFLAVTLYALRNRGKRRPGQSVFDVARAEFGDEAAEGPPAVLKIVVVFSMVTFFWALFDQHSSTWIKQAELLDRSITAPFWTSRWIMAAVVGLGLLGLVWLLGWVSNRAMPRVASFVVIGLVAAAGVAAGVTDAIQGQWAAIELQPSQLAALNPLMVMIIIPLMNVGVYRPLERRGFALKPLVRMTIGMFLSAAGFAAAALLQERIAAAAGSGEQVHVLWQVVQYWIMTTAEVLISITGLEFAYTQAPRPMKSTIMGFWLLTVTFGNIVVAFLAPLQQTYTLAQFFWLFTALMAAAALVFSVLAYFYKGKTYLQEEQA